MLKKIEKAIDFGARKAKKLAGWIVEMLGIEEPPKENKKSSKREKK